MAEPVRCSNHPDVATRLACSACGTPICPRCMHQSAVGQKCARCARVPRSARALGKPRDHVAAAAAALVIVVLGGPVYATLVARVGFALILAFLLGLASGRVVDAAVRRQRTPRFRMVAVVASVGAVVFGAQVVGLPIASVWGLLTLVLAGWGASRAV